MTRLLPLLLACSSLDPDGYSAHVPSQVGCGRVAIASYTAEAECLKLEDTNGRTLFKRSTSDSCGGPACLVLQPGESGYVLEKAKFGEAAEWSVQGGPCEELAPC